MVNFTCMVSLILRTIFLSIDGIMFVMEATISKEMLEKVWIWKMNFAWAAFEQAYCEHGSGKGDGTWYHSKAALFQDGAVFPVAWGGLWWPSNVKFTRSWSCWKCVLSEANSVCYAWRVSKNPSVPVGNFLLSWKSLNSKDMKCLVGKFPLPCMVSSNNQEQIIQCCV